MSFLILKNANKHKFQNVLMSGFSAEVSCGRVGGTVGAHGLGVRNERVSFCQEKDRVIANTWFQNY